MSKIGYFFLLSSSLGNIPFNAVMASDPTISFRLARSGNFWDNNEHGDRIYNDIIKGLKNAGLHRVAKVRNSFDEDYLDIKKSALTSDTSNEMGTKELYSKLRSILSKAYSWSGSCTVKIKIAKKQSRIPTDIDEETMPKTDLTTKGLEIYVREVEVNNKVKILGILGIVTLVSISLIFCYLYFFKKSAKEAPSEQKINEEASLEKPTVQEEAQEKESVLGEVALQKEV